MPSCSYPTRPESVLARNAVNDALQRTAGRTDPVAVSDEELQEPGSRYIDFLVPGLLGMGLMGGGPVGCRVRHRRYADPQAPETPPGHAHAQGALPCGS